MVAPITPAGNGDSRAPDGRFLPGNSAGRGNPLNKRVQMLRNALLAAVTEEDVAEVVQVLLGKAKAGKVPAIRELLDRLLGKAPQSVALTDPDGEPLGFSLHALQAALLEALGGFPEAKLAVAAKLRELTRANPDRPGDGA